MKTKIVMIGKSKGICLPKPILDQTHITEDVELSVRDGSIIIQSISQPRANWEAAFRSMAANGDDKLIDGENWPSATFDANEWDW